MKKTVLIILAVLMAFVIVSCKQDVEAYVEKGYSVGDYGPAGGRIFYINPNADADGWKYLEVCTVKLEGAGTSADVYYSTFDPADAESYMGAGSSCHLKVEFIGAETGMGKGPSNTAKWNKALADQHVYSSISKYAANTPTKATATAFSIAAAMTTGGKKDWFIPSAEEAKALCASGLVSCAYGIWTSNQKTTNAEFCPIGGASADSFPYDSTQGPNTYWYAIRRF